jgi:hypothetical protein
MLSAAVVASQGDRTGVRLTPVQRRQIGLARVR